MVAFYLMIQKYFQKSDSSYAEQYPMLRDLFDKDWYLSQKNAGLHSREPLTDYLTSGYKKGISPHPLFDEAWYMQQYPDVASSNISGLLHYMKYGWKENRSPNDFLDLNFLINKFPNSCGLAHFAKSDFLLRNLDSYRYNSNSILQLIKGYFNNERETILSFTHGLGGGVDVAVSRINNKLKSKFNLLTVSSHDKQVGDYLINLNIKNEHSEFDYLAPKDIFLQLLNSSSFKPNYIFFHHALHIEQLVKDVANLYNKSKYLFIHDYYFFNPFWSTIGTESQRGSLPMLDDEYANLLNSDESAKTLVRWGSPSTWKDFINDMDLLLAPSETVIQSLESVTFAKQKIQKYKIPDVSYALSSPEVIHQKHDKIRVCIMGDIGEHKGLSLLRELIMSKDRTQIEFVCLGTCEIPDSFFLEKIAQYDTNNYLYFLQKMDPDIIFLPNQVEETYSYVLSEALSFGSLIVASDIKVFVERAGSFRRVLLSSKSNNVNEWRSKLLGAISKYNQLAESSYKDTEVTNDFDFLKDFLISDL